MSTVDADGDSERDLVIVALPAVQRFITEAKTTSDVASASEIYSALAERVVAVFQERPGHDLVLPAGTAAAPDLRAPGMPNRAVARFPEGTGAAAAAAASVAVHDMWRDWLRRALRPKDGVLPPTPGFPKIQWVCVPPDPDGYPAQWKKAQRLLDARKRVRDFAPVPEEEWRRRALCSLSPRWPAEPKAPPRTPRHDRESKLSAVGWVKRSWRRENGREGFPSTSSISSAPYRQAVLRELGGSDEIRQAVEALEKAAVILEAPPETPVPGLLIPDSGVGRWLGRSGGPWVYPDRWQRDTLVRQAPDADPARLARAADAGAAAARGLRTLMAERGVPLTSYLAVVVQDIDGMGRFLGGTEAVNAAGEKIKILVSPNEGRRLSRVLVTLAEEQSGLVRDPDLLGVPVYAGGDDLLAFVPAATALRAAERANRAIPADLPTASTAVLYFHQSSSIQHAMSTARRLLDEAKEKVPGKHGLTVGFLRRSGTSESTVQPWRGPDERSTAALLGVFAGDAGHPLSPNLATDLARDADELAGLLEASDRVYRAELGRLVRRHSGGPASAGTAQEAADALYWLGTRERGHDEDAGEKPGPHIAARVAVFLRQEAG